MRRALRSKVGAAVTDARPMNLKQVFPKVSRRIIIVFHLLAVATVSLFRFEASSLTRRRVFDPSLLSLPSGPNLLGPNNIQSRRELRLWQNRQLHSYLTAPDYVSPLEQYPSPRGGDDAHHLPPPIKAIQRYIAQHHRNIVLAEISQQRSARGSKAHSSHERLYTLVYYSCPHSAGNWLHNVVSTVTWAMLMNRTIVWKYMDPDECNAVRNSMDYKFDVERCEPPAANVKSDCTPNILTLAQDWMLDYDSVAPRLGWTSKSVVRLSRWATKDRVQPMNRTKLAAANVNAMVALDNHTHYSRFPLIAMYPWLKRMTQLQNEPLARATQLMHNASRQYLDKELYAWGLPFWNGLVLRSCFDFSPTIKQTVREALMMQSQWYLIEPLEEDRLVKDDGSDDHLEPFSIVLHSRHTVRTESGCVAEREQACLEALLRRKAAEWPMHDCRVVALSDRVCTIQNLKVWLKHIGAKIGSTCQVLSIDHGHIQSDKMNNSLPAYDMRLTEHGPFGQGGSFLADVLLASLTARHGMIGKLEPRDGDRWRSSSELVEDFVAFSRMMEFWQERQYLLFKEIQGIPSDRRNDASIDFGDLLECTLADSNTISQTRDEELSTGSIKVKMIPHINR